MAKGTKKAKSAKRERRERRFLPRSTTNLALVQGVGGVGAAALGAGAWAQFGRTMVAKAADAAEPLAYGPWLLAGGAVLLGVAVWLGTSGEPALHVGDGGVGLEKSGSVRRIPWHLVERVTYDRAARAVVVAGKDETGAALVVKAPLGAQPQAAAWILKEATARIPAVVEAPDEAAARDLPEPIEAGEVLALEPVQVVGKHCAASGTVIAYEPDARVCPRCERVYHKAHVPAECACGASLESLQEKAG